MGERTKNKEDRGGIYEGNSESEEQRVVSMEGESRGREGRRDEEGI